MNIVNNITRGLGKAPSSIVLDFFESDISAMTHRHHKHLHAVRKSTREVTTLGRRREMGNTSFFRCTYSNKDMFKKLVKKL